jgi:hypothetical protein
LLTFNSSSNYKSLLKIIINTDFKDPLLKSLKVQAHVPLYAANPPSPYPLLSPSLRNLFFTRPALILFLSIAELLARPLSDAVVCGVSYRIKVICSDPSSMMIQSSHGKEAERDMLPFHRLPSSAALLMHATSYPSSSLPPLLVVVALRLFNSAAVGQWGLHLWSLPQPFLLPSVRTNEP